MIQLIGELSSEYKTMVLECFEQKQLEAQFVGLEDLAEDSPIISLDKNSTKRLEQYHKKYFNWDLLFSVLGPNDQAGDFKSKLEARIKVLQAILKIAKAPVGNEFHGSIRVHDLAQSSAFYSWLFAVTPKEWTHRYVTFVRPDTKFNFVLLVADGKELSHDTLYHLGMGVSSKQKVVDFYHSAVENGFHVEKPPRTTWRGTPLHELWLKDPDGTAIEIYARLTDAELEQMPEDKEPIFLV